METLVDTALTLKELFDAGELDIRNYNLCKRNGFETVGELISYYQEVGTFRGIHNCGLISDNTLKTICKRYSKLQENGVRIEKQPVNFKNMEKALQALQSGYIDVLVFTRNTMNYTIDQHRLTGAVGVCNPIKDIS